MPIASYYWQDDTLTYLMLSEDKLFASKFQNGNSQYLNQAIHIPDLSDEFSNISKRTLALQHLEGHSYILSGQKKVTEEGRTNYVFFMKKIEVE
ncbi:hypothetical protein [Litoribacter populi]|uniref:hypothetical protein n=1 Tax=Litoribacter populi TaxID=2598460 RepID=UPI0011811F67|nr:hypothetical protein [Litoribacter populi]